MRAPDEAVRTHWPECRQVVRTQTIWRPRRPGVRPRSIQDRHYLVTGPKGARPLAASVLQRRIRGRWGIENRHFHVKDRTLDEDRSQARCGTAARTLLRTVATTLLSLAPLTGKRRAYAPEKRTILAASPMRAVRLLVMPLI